MQVLEASLNGTLRTILVLVAVWWLLRMVLRYQNARTMGNTNGPTRPKGDVRIDDAASAGRGTRSTDGHIIDAEYEEIK